MSFWFQKAIVSLCPIFGWWEIDIFLFFSFFSFCFWIFFKFWRCYQQSYIIPGTYVLEEYFTLLLELIEPKKTLYFLSYDHLHNQKTKKNPFFSDLFQILKMLPIKLHYSRNICFRGILYLSFGVDRAQKDFIFFELWPFT